MTATLAPDLPGIALAGEVAGPRPDVLRAEGALLLRDVVPGRTRTWVEHRAGLGPVPELDLHTLAALAEVADLRGYGGAGFPTAVKLRSVRGSRAPLVVVNATEGEHASAKDGVLLRHVPHLVLDGALAAAHALGAAGVVVRLAADRPDLPHVVRAAAAERGLPTGAVRVSVGPATFAAGESSAVVNGLSGRPAVPAPLGRPPYTPSRLPARRQPVFLSNVETFARLARVARGLPADSALVTVSGAVGYAGVVELPPAARVDDAVEAVGGVRGPVSTLVTGGWHGRWLAWSGDARSAPLTRAGLAAVGARWGAGVLVLISSAHCPLAVVAAVARALAAGSTGQCGPCRSGLPQVAGALTGLAARTGPVVPVPGSLDRHLDALDGRGLCAHPTASVAALRSALDRVAADLAAHASGRCVALVEHAQR